jgi:hypothetical protein
MGPEAVDVEGLASVERFDGPARRGQIELCAEGKSQP